MVRRGLSLLPGRFFLAAAIAHVVFAIILVPVTSHPYDLVALTGPAEAWLRWQVPLLFGWKFGLNLAFLVVLAEALRTVIQAMGVSGVSAAHIAWKLPLVASDLVAGVMLLRLCQRFLWARRSQALAALWLLSPVVLWVSAVHGQTESLALVCLFAALELALAGRYGWSGILTGLGAGIAYFPLAVAAAVAVWWLQGGLGRKQAIRYGVALAATLLGAFGPLLIDPVGRAGIVGQLASSAGVATNFPPLLSIWSVLGTDWAQLWPILFLITSALWVVFVVRRGPRGPAAGILTIAGLLVLAVLLDRNAEAQFVVIGAAGLWLLALIIPIQPLVLVLVPVVGLSTVFFFLEENANAYFYDEWWQRGAALLTIPQNQSVAGYLGHLGTIGLLAGFGYALFPQYRPRRLSWVLGSLAATIICVAFCLWSLQPELLYLRGHTVATEPADFADVVATRAFTFVPTSDGLDVRYPANFRLAAGSAGLPPQGVLGFTAADLLVPQGAVRADPASAWSKVTITIPKWSNLRNSVQVMWAELLMGSSAWQTSSAVRLDGAKLSVSGDALPVQRAVWVSPGWARVAFRVPASDVDSGGRLTVAMSSSLLWNGSLTTPWLRLAPAAGTLRSIVNGAPRDVRYQSDVNGNGYLLGLPTKDYAIRPSRLDLPGLLLTEAGLQWPWNGDALSTSWWLSAMGLLYGLAVGLGSLTLLLAVTTGLPGRMIPIWRGFPARQRRPYTAIRAKDIGVRPVEAASGAATQPRSQDYPSLDQEMFDWCRDSARGIHRGERDDAPFAWPDTSGCTLDWLEYFRLEVLEESSRRGQPDGSPVGDQAAR